MRSSVLVYSLVIYRLDENQIFKSLLKFVNPENKMGCSASKEVMETLEEQVSVHKLSIL